MTDFEVPPGAGRKFIKAWEKLAEHVEKCSANKAFSLSKIMDDNTSFAAYSVWELPPHPHLYGITNQAVAEAAANKKGRGRKHFDAVGKFIREIEELGVTLKNTPIMPIREVPRHSS